MNRYVVAFVFNETLNRVWLIRKNKPEWQKGCLNGIGGKIEEGETAEEAMHRELLEESGVSGIDLFNVGKMIGSDNDNTCFSVEVFTGITDQTLQTMEEEQIHLVTIDLMKQLKDDNGPVKCIETVPALIELCIYYHTKTSNFKNFVLNY